MVTSKYWGATSTFQKISIIFLTFIFLLQSYTSLFMWPPEIFLKISKTFYMFWSNVLFSLQEKNAEKGEKDNLTISQKLIKFMNNKISKESENFYTHYIKYTLYPLKHYIFIYNNMCTYKYCIYIYMCIIYPASYPHHVFFHHVNFKFHSKDIMGVKMTQQI